MLLTFPQRKPIWGSHGFHRKLTPRPRGDITRSQTMEGSVCEQQNLETDLRRQQLSGASTREMWLTFATAAIMTCLCAQASNLSTHRQQGMGYRLAFLEYLLFRDIPLYRTVSCLQASFSCGILTLPRGWERWLKTPFSSTFLWFWDQSFFLFLKEIIWIHGSNLIVIYASFA